MEGSIIYSFITEEGSTLDYQYHMNSFPSTPDENYAFKLPNIKIMHMFLTEHKSKIYWKQPKHYMSCYHTRLVPRSWFIKIFTIHQSKSSSFFLGKTGLIPELRVEKYKLIPEYTAVLEKGVCSEIDGVCQKVLKHQPERVPIGQIWENVSMKKKKMQAMDYNPQN